MAATCSKAQWEESQEKPILMVGVACIDKILTCTEYPLEDTMINPLNFSRRRGGNASNSCTVLSQLNTKCELLTAFGDDDDAEFMKRDLDERGISFNSSPTHYNHASPNCFVITSLENGSRTGLIYRGSLPELSFEDFCKIDISKYSWIHFEGRCAAEVKKMIAFIDRWNGEQEKGREVPYSVELELSEEGTRHFLPLANVLFVSKDFAQYQGFDDMPATIKGISQSAKDGAVIIVPWGDLGAIARCEDGKVVTCPAYSPPKVVDTIGAGDTFIAATLSLLSKGKSVKDAVEFGCRVAGTKVGMDGFQGLGAKIFGVEKQAP